MSRVYIGNIGDNASKREIEREFETFGPLRDVWVARNPPGFAFCVFEDRRDAEDAVRELDGRYICGQRARVELAKGPSRGRPRQASNEKCYECGRVGHFARDCTRRRYGGGRSRSPSPRGRRRSRSRSPVRRRRSPSLERRSRSRSGSRERRRSPSRSPERRRERSFSNSPKRERHSPDHRNGNEGTRDRSQSRSPTPVKADPQHDD